MLIFPYPLILSVELGRLYYCVVLESELLKPHLHSSLGTLVKYEFYLPPDCYSISVDYDY